MPVKAFTIKRMSLFVDIANSNENNGNFALSSRNLVGVKYIGDGSINIFDLLSHGAICITRDALTKIITHFYEKLYLIK